MSFDNQNFDVLVSDPESWTGAEALFVGQVFTVERDSDGVYLQVYADPKNYEWNTVVLYGDPNFEVAQDDFVQVEGVVRGSFEGENALGGTVSAPLVDATRVEVVPATAAAAPASRTLRRKVDNQYGITLQVKKVEFSDNETRVFVALSNRSGAKFNFYSYSALAISGGRQVESTFSDIEYPEIADTIQTGARSSGVIVFPKMNPRKKLTLTFEGNSDNFDFGDFGTVTWKFEWR